MFKRPPIFQLALLSCLAFSAPLHAESETTEPSVTFSGFGTIGAVHTQGNGASFSRDITQAKGATNRGLFWETDSRIGLQATIKPTEELEGVAQIISRYQTDNNFQPELTWGFLKYSPNDTVEVRAGRVGFNVYLLGDSRDIGFSYLWVRPPVEFYGAIMIPYVDGGDIIFSAPIGDGVSRLKLFSGLSRQQVHFLFNQTQWAGNITFNTGSNIDASGSRVSGGRLDYQDNNWTLQLGRASIMLSNEADHGHIDLLSLIRSSADAEAPTAPALARSLNALANDFSVAGHHITFSSLGLAYENGPLRSQMEISHYGSETLTFPATNTGYLSVGYRHGKLTPYAVISAVRSKKSSRADELAGKGVDPTVSIANFVLTTGQQVQHTYSVGMRYDLTSNAALKFQMDMIHNHTCSPVSLPIIGPSPSCSSPLLWTTVPVSWDGRANVYSAVLDFTF